MEEAVEKKERSVKELIEGMKEGAEEMISGDTVSDNDAIRSRIQELREDL